MGVQRTSNRVNPHLWVAAFTLAIASAGPSPSATTTPFTASAPASLVRPGDQPLEQYRALRRMHAHNEKMNHEGWLDAWTELESGVFRYQIVAERGSGTVRNRVLKAILKREQELIANGDFGRGELTADNYEFGPETSANGLRFIPMKPKREDVMLVDGRMVLSPEGELLRVEGVLAKNPSFWTTRVNVVRSYARVDGVRVPVSVESIAKVRFAGLSRLNVRYEYESINHRPVGMAGRPVAAGTLHASGR